MYPLILLLLGIVLYFCHSFIIAVPYDIQQGIFLGTTLLLGVPHGAADLMVARNTALAGDRPFSVTLFFAEYLGLIILFVLVFYFFPLIANFIFILLAAYHFGESDMHRYKISGYAGVAFQGIYGLLIIAVIILPHWDEALSLISVIAGKSQQQHILTVIQNSRSVIFYILTFSILISTAFYLSKPDIAWREKIDFLICTTAIILILLQLPMLLGFTVYFVFWHSLRSIHQIVTYLLRHRSLPLPHIVLEMIFYSVMAILGVGIICIFGYGYADVRSLQLYIFLGLAVLTAPHMRIMHQLKVATDTADTDV